MSDLSVNQEQCINEVLNFIKTYKKYPSAIDNVKFAHMRSEYINGRYTEDKMRVIESKLPFFKIYMEKCKKVPHNFPKDFKIKDLELASKTPMIQDSEQTLINDVNDFVKTNKRFPLATEMYRFHRFKLRYYNDHDNDPTKKKARQAYICSQIPYFKEYIELYEHYDQNKVNGPERTYDLETIKAFKNNQFSKKRKTTEESKAPIKKIQPDKQDKPEIDYVKIGIENGVIQSTHMDKFEELKHNIKDDYKITIHKLAIQTYLDNNQPIPPEVYRQDLLYRDQQDHPTKDYLTLGFEEQIFDFSTISAFKDKGIDLDGKYQNYSYGCILEDLIKKKQPIPPEIFVWYVMNS